MPLGSSPKNGGNYVLRKSFERCQFRFPRRSTSSTSRSNMRLGGRRNHDYEFSLCDKYPPLDELDARPHPKNFSELKVPLRRGIWTFLRKSTALHPDGPFIQQNPPGRRQCRKFLALPNTETRTSCICTKYTGTMPSVLSEGRSRSSPDVVTCVSAEGGPVLDERDTAF